MNETLTFVLQLKDMVSGGLAKIASSAQSSFTGIDRRVEATRRNLSMASMSVQGLNDRLNQLTQKRDLALNTSDLAKANREIYAIEQRLNKLNNTGVNRSGGGGMKMPWWLSGAVLAGVAGAGIMTMVKTGADQQRDITGLSTFMGAKKAQTFYSQVQQDARITPFVTHDLMMADRMLISTGMNADRARRNIMDLANAVAATGGGNYALERMALHMQQIASKGHADMVQINEFGRAGINIMQLLSDATGKHMKMTHGMTVSYKDIENALAHAAGKGGMFYNALFAQSQTIWGKWSTLVDDLQVSAGRIVDGQSKGITGLLDLLDGYAQRLPALVEQWSGGITTMVHGAIWFTGTLIEMAKWVYHNWSWLKYVVGMMLSFKIAMWAATTATGIYNTMMTIAAMRTTALAVAEGEAAAAAMSLQAAMAATPWGLIAAGVAAVGIAIVALVEKSRGAGKEITNNLDPNKGQVIMPETAREPTYTDAITNNGIRNGSVIAKPWGGYRWAGSNIMDAPLNVAEQKILEDGRRNHPMGLGERDKWAMALIKKNREAEAARMPALVIYKPAGIDGPKAHGAAGGEKDEESSDGGAITGGGSKNITFNITRFTDKFEVVVGGMNEAVAKTEEEFKEMFLRVVYSAKAAL